MPKIIKSGKKEFIGKCHKCGCEFSYTIKEVYPFNCVHCPECDDAYYHPDQSNSPNWTVRDYASEKEIQDTLNIFKQFNSVGEVKS